MAAGSRSAREGLEHAAELSPGVAWDDLHGLLEAAWKPGQHVSIFGPTGSGKSTLLVELLELTPQPAVLFVTKRRDKFLTGLTKRGWVLCRTLEQVKSQVARRTGDRYFGRRVDATPPRILYWPPPTGTIAQRRRRLQATGRALFDWVYDRGGVTLGVDEGYYVVKQLGLTAETEDLLHEGRSGRASIVIASQRPSSLPLSAYSSPSYLLMFGTNEPADLKRLSEIGGKVDPKPLRAELQLLPWHSFLFVAPRTSPATIVRSRVDVRRQ